jgi:hypothetical protein
LKLPDEGSRLLLLGGGLLKTTPCPIACLDPVYGFWISRRLWLPPVGILARDRLGGVLPLCEGWGGEVESLGVFHGPFVRVPQVSASDEAARAPDPLGPSVKLSLPVVVPASVTARLSSVRPGLPRDVEASLFVLVKPPPMGLVPQMPLDGCHVLPLLYTWPSVEVWADLSSLLCLPEVALKSPNRFARAWRRWSAVMVEREFS